MCERYAGFRSAEVCRGAGRRCPGQISILGFDDLTLTEFMTPKLSTVRVLKESTGARAARMILEKAGEPDAAAEHILISTDPVFLYFL
ncbi:MULTISPECIES: substrate-binding domain-containing protein [Paenibacillus]|uniref:substrate-binding domain-containing protein n=1 Tax=Paenibacillus TaxID=44249 RepID=UPI0022B908A2|nr:substrate-binding domain-containing protein [Paenibacillus caseinilyticus]MCZ8517883.1 substrate-binding domain-containing protein [Paenibacillus caseinilyticus]